MGIRFHNAVSQHALSDNFLSTSMAVEEVIHTDSLQKYTRGEYVVGIDLLSIYLLRGAAKTCIFFCAEMRPSEIISVKNGGNNYSDRS